MYKRSPNFELESKLLYCFGRNQPDRVRYLLSTGNLLRKRKGSICTIKKLCNCLAIFYLAYCDCAVPGGLKAKCFEGKYMHEIKWGRRGGGLVYMHGYFLEQYVNY